MKVFRIDLSILFKRIILIIFLLPNLQCFGQIMIDSSWINQTLYKSYDYPKYTIDSLIYENGYKQGMKHYKDLKKMYFDSLHVTTTYYNRTKLPQDSLPNEYLIHIYLSGGQYNPVIDGPIAYQAIIYDNLDDTINGLIIYQNSNKRYQDSTRTYLNYGEIDNNYFIELRKLLNSEIIWDTADYLSHKLELNNGQWEPYGFIELNIRYRDKCFYKYFNFQENCFYGINELLYEWIEESVNNKVQPMINEITLITKDKILKIDTHFKLNSRIESTFNYILRHK
jgi:hypothetical protein